MKPTIFHKSQLCYFLLGISIVQAWISHNQKLPYTSSSLSSSSSSFAKCVTTPPFLAVITEPTSCDSEEKMESAIKAITSAVSTQKVLIVSVRIAKTDMIDEKTLESRVKRFTNKIIELAKVNKFYVVVSSDWLHTVEVKMPVGIHVKENHRSKIPAIRQRFGPDFLLGTSAHSIESAVEAVSKYSPDYLFVGTCYKTASHPEKETEDLEGPELPGQVRRVLQEKYDLSSPIVLAIGGIDEENCRSPVLEYGADGVAAIRSILSSTNPAETVLQMQSKMQHL